MSDGIFLSPPLRPRICDEQSKTGCAYATDNESVRECQSWNQLSLDVYPICIYIGGSIGILGSEILSLIVDGESILILSV